FHDRYKILFILLFVFCVENVYAKIRNEVLIIDSYSSDYQWSNSIIDGIKNLLSDDISGLYLNIEYLSSERFTNPSIWVERINMLFSNYTENLPAAIVLISDEAWMSYRAAQNEHFNDVPLFLCAVKPHSITIEKYSSQSETLSLSDFTPTDKVIKSYKANSIIRKMNIDGYIDLMNTLIPNLNQYTFITDNRFYGIYTRLLLEDYFKRNGMSHPVNYLDARFITTDTLIKQLNYITHKTGLLLTSWLTGEVGFEYSKQYVYNLMSSVLKTPIFITNDIGINSGHFLGGYYFNAENWGKETGKQILDVLKYHRTTKNKCLTETQCHINWNVLEKFNILQSQLPKNTKFVNARQSFFIEYYTECIFIGSLLLLILLGSIYVLHNNIKLQKKQKIVQQSIEQVAKSNKNLIKMQKSLQTALVKAEAADRLKSSFINNIDHEIRTPLNAIVGFSSIIATIEDKNDIDQANLQIAENSDILLKIIHDIMDLSQIDAGTAEFDYHKVNLNWLFEDLLQMSERKLHEGVTLKFCPPEKPISMITEPVRVLQILINLTDNAIKFTFNGTIEFGYFQYDDQWVEFYVKDTGIGISKDEVDKIFNRFYKSDMYVRGSGLGLSISKQIIETMSGQYGVISDLGIGSLFWFRFKNYNKENYM
ncbi:MAG: HAMP domain-containing sensor histidine kinase, partial [Odoribacter sp.]